MKHPTPVRYYLAKTEPTVYSIQDLQRDKKTVWDGVRNPHAVHAIKEMHGDHSRPFPEFENGTKDRPKG